ncbi:nicotinate dehydrogenase subunit A [Pricia antarctica]|uniref:Nicotinate dehydrogenase subunit A n=1 Tax=Pricia antarctica TaxID=641691 RepID=A0A1G6Y9J8_9FLAO|nr:(2Fe-2S)-binding protein [Pricia antarctica]SDD86972.1 nicotinate dehydrogenase subunit A [Pricia antarctica]
MKTDIQLNVNGKEHTVQSAPDTPLLYVLRNQLELNGPKFGCGLQQCGACMVLLDGKSTTSCQLPVRTAAKYKITTLEGLVDENGRLHKIQEAFVKEQAAQCGYCLNGIIIASVALLNESPSPTDDEIKEKLNLNICRCGVHSRVVRAVKASIE